MKAYTCSICGSDAKVTHLDLKGKGTFYGVSCDEGHFIADNYGTKNRAIQAWNDCQSFVDRYTEAE